MGLGKRFSFGLERDNVRARHRDRPGSNDRVKLVVRIPSIGRLRCSCRTPKSLEYYSRSNANRIASAQGFGVVPEYWRVQMKSCRGP